MNTGIKQAIQNTRSAIEQSLGKQLEDIATSLSDIFYDTEALQNRLGEVFRELSDSKYMYVLDARGIQITDNLTHDGTDSSQRGRDRSLRPYMAGMFGKTNFRLSQAYISRNARRPSLTAIQKVRSPDGKRLGFIGIDYDLRELSSNNAVYEDDTQWQQIKGDPSIRANLFSQVRVQSEMDDHLDDVFALMVELMQEHGIFHGKLHFASSRATVWHVDDPYDYRLLSIQELLNPDICLAFPRTPYFERATIPKDEIMSVFKQFCALRFADETIYLRAGSLNTVNGMIGLNFSCDGSHYLHYKEFLNKGLAFWFGSSST